MQCVMSSARGRHLLQLVRGLEARSWRCNISAPAISQSVVGQAVPAASLRAVSSLTTPRQRAAVRLCQPALSATSPAGTSGARWQTSTLAANEVREGDLLEEEGGLWRVISRVFSRTAMGRAYVQMELRSLDGSTKRDVRYRSEDTLTKAVLDSPAKYSVLYSTGDTLACMHQHTFEQIELPVSFMGDRFQYVQDGMILTIENYKGEPAVLNIPARITVIVKEMDEGGGVAIADTALTPEATFSSTFKIRVPKFIKVGDKLSIETADNKYVGRE
jgi:elongation factor P